jgi:signal transduction histidine kinase
MVIWGVIMLIIVMSSLVVLSRRVNWFASRMLADLNVLASSSELPMAFIEFSEIQNQMKKKLELERENGLMKSKSILGELASQVAHDIRSPLAALSHMEGDLAVLDEEKRILLRSAVNRIYDIANNLLEKNRKSQQPAKDESSEPSVRDQSSTQLLSSLIEPLISEKRLQFRSKIGIEINSLLKQDSYGLFASIQPIEFKRVMSNLVNNAVEVLGERGEVQVSLRSVADTIELRVVDNGKGIPPKILDSAVRLTAKPMAQAWDFTTPVLAWNLGAGD